jgi:hypothetical protein
MKAGRLSLTLDEHEMAELEEMTEALGTKTKTRTIRRALRFYKRVVGLKKQGFLIQAIKGGILKQFPNLDDPIPEDIPLRRPPQK